MAKVFISYRRADSVTFSGRIYDRLIGKFGRRNVFKDVDDIPAGVHFAHYIQDSLRQCAIELVVIGPQWLDARDARGNRRLDDLDDFVRVEIETALSLGITVIPLLLDGATMPTGDDLPGPLRPLAMLNALLVRNDPDFGRDMERVITSVERAFASRPGAGLFGRRLATSSPWSPTTPASQSQPPVSGAEFGPAQSAQAVPTQPKVPTESVRSAGTWTRIWRPLIGGLAAIVIVASFAALFSAGPGRSLFANAAAGNHTGPDKTATQQRLDGISTATARAQSLTVRFPYVAAAPGKGCDQGNLAWTIAPGDGTGIQCFADHSTLTPRGGSSTLQWTTSDYATFPQPGRLSFALANYAVSGGDSTIFRQFIFNVTTHGAYYGLNLRPEDHTWSVLASGAQGNGATNQNGTYNPNGRLSVSVTIVGGQVTFVVGGKTVGPFTESAPAVVESFSFSIGDATPSSHIDLSAFRLEQA